MGIFRFSFDIVAEALDAHPSLCLDGGGHTLLEPLLPLHIKFSDESRDVTDVSRCCRVKAEPL